MALPPRFIERMQRLLGADAVAFFGTLERPPLKGLRVNTLKVSVEAFRELVAWRLEPLPWCKTGFLVPDEAAAGKHPFHAAGLYYLQEPSAMAVAEALSPKPGELVLDLAAAPGGKSTHLVSLMQDQGLVVANEVNRGRVGALLENLERWGTRRALISNETVSRLAQTWGAVFDRVLLDAPCSGEGMFRKSADALTMWSEENVLACASRQETLLAEAAELVKPGGVLTYSTCTFAPEENEEVIAKFLKARDDFVLEEVTLEQISPGRPEWARAALRTVELAKAGRLWPHLTSGEGHFIAVLRRREGKAAKLRSAEVDAIPHNTRKLWQDFVSKTLQVDPAEDAALTIFGDKLYAVPEGLPSLQGLRTLRAGLWLGTLKKGRFEPSHALALALKGGDAAHTIDLAPDDKQVLRYLQGDILEAAGEDGWLLVTVVGFPLGWGKRSQGVVKNAYPKGLRVR